MKVMSLVVLAATFGLFAHADEMQCQRATTYMEFSKSAVHANLTWMQGPRTPDESMLKVEWTKDGQPVEPGTFKVSLYMPAMGHGSAPTQLQRVSDGKGGTLTGVYQVSSMYFTMGGDWQVDVSLKNTDGSEETQELNVHLDGGMMMPPHHH